MHSARTCLCLAAQSKEDYTQANAYKPMPMVRGVQVWSTAVLQEPATRGGEIPQSIHSNH